MPAIISAAALRPVVLTVDNPSMTGTVTAIWGSIILGALGIAGATLVTVLSGEGGAATAGLILASAASIISSTWGAAKASETKHGQATLGQTVTNTAEATRLTVEKVVGKVEKVAEATFHQDIALADIQKIGTQNHALGAQNHALLNSGWGAQLRLTVSLARTLAEVRGHAEDKEALALAEKALQDYEARQGEADKLTEGERP